MKAVDSRGHSWEINRQPPGFSRTLDKADFDLLEVANALFDCETLTHQGERITEVEVPFYQEYDPSLAQELAHLFAMVLEHELEVSTVRNPQPRFFPGSPFPNKKGYTCLFSGGIDSYSTILLASEEFGHVTGCFVDHSGFHKLRGVFNRLDLHIASNESIVMRRVAGNEHGTFLRRSRGAYYAFLGILLGNQNLIVGEAGATMYQPKLTVLDEVTITAYPGLLKRVGDIAGLMLGPRPTIIIPGEDMTKAEMMSACPDPDWLKRTFSCSSTTRYATDIGIGHCGSCFSCIVRRLAGLVSRVDDRGYAFDVAGPRPSDLALDNLVQLLRFSIDYLSDFDHIPVYTKGIIESNNKSDLFERFCEDNLAGLMLLTKGANEGPVVSKMRALSKSMVDDEKLRERIEIVRSKSKQPNFGTMI